VRLRYASLFWCVLALGALALPVGCGDSPLPGGPPEDGECLDTNDCAAGSVCEAGECIALAEEGDACVEDNDCQAGLICTDGTCSHPPSTSCVSDEDCAGDLVCWQGECLTDPDDGDDDHCAPGEVFICHVPPGNPPEAETKCVGYKAAKAHLTQHPDDRLGECP